MDVLGEYAALALEIRPGAQNPPRSRKTIEEATATPLLNKVLPEATEHFIYSHKHLISQELQENGYASLKAKFDRLYNLGVFQFELTPLPRDQFQIELLCWDGESYRNVNEILPEILRGFEDVGSESGDEQSFQGDVDQISGDS